MDFSYKKLVAVALLCSGLIACSSTDDEDESTRVAELTEIDQKFTPQVKWDVSTDGVGDYFSRLKPTVAYGKVFTGARDGEAVAFDIETGNQVWSKDLSNLDDSRGFFDSKQSALLNGGPIAGINQVFYGSENGEVFALKEDSGELVWREDVKGEVITAPAIGEGALVVHTVSGVMKAFDANNGEALWEIELEVPPLSLRGISAPTIAAGGVLVGTASGEITVFVLDKGQQAWVAEIGEASGATELDRVIDVDSKPLVFGDKIYTVSARGHLVAIDLRSGQVLWKRQYSSYRQLSIAGNTIYLTDVKGHVYAIDRTNGLERWSQLALTNRQVTGPAILGDYVVVGDFEGYLHFLDQETGEIVSRYQVDGSGVYATPTVADNVLYVQSRDGDLEAITVP